MKNKTLLIVCGTLEAGGAERVISILSTPFAENFQHVNIINWIKAPVFYKIDHRVQIMNLPDMADSNNNITKGLKLRQYVKAAKPEMVLSFLTPFNMLNLTFLCGLTTPVVVAERNDPRFIKGGKVMSLIRNSLYRMASGVLCQTDSMANYFPVYLRRKTHVIYNPIVFYKNLQGTALNTAKRKRIVTVGRLHPQKCHKLLIDSFRIFHQTHSDYTLTIYGNGHLHQSTTEYIAEIGLEHCIELAEACKNVHELIVDAKLFMLTSRYEGMPNALIEAMCLGLPCISTKVSGAIDLIKTGNNGILVDDNAELIAQAMNDIIDNPPFAKDLGCNAALLYYRLNIDLISNEWITYLDSKIK